MASTKLRLSLTGFFNCQFFFETGRKIMPYKPLKSYFWFHGETGRYFCVLRSLDPLGTIHRNQISLQLQREHSTLLAVSQCNPHRYGGMPVYKCNNAEEINADYFLNSYKYSSFKTICAQYICASSTAATSWGSWWGSVEPCFPLTWLTCLSWPLGNRTRSHLQVMLKTEQLVSCRESVRWEHMRFEYKPFISL